ncbi:MAG: alpha/beta hydrolase [Bryobacterales bacterium]|nr:alpha/beta hydrolase [Bryobacterales bacterium]
MRAAAILLLVSAATAGIAVLVPQKPDLPPPGRFVTVDGARLHLWCTGQGSPTIVLEAGLGGTMLSWAWLQPELARSTRVCSYDRPGMGWSEPLAHPRDGRSQARLLHRLLAAAGEQGPYILAGHSIGGAYVRLFRDQYRNEVAGLILIDSVQPGYCERMPGAEESVHSLSVRLSLCRRAAVLPLAPVLLPRMAAWEDLPAPAQPAATSFERSSRQIESMERETSEWFPTLKQVAQARPLRDLPLLVLSSESAAGPVRPEWMPYWREMQKDLGTLSRQSVSHTVPGANQKTIIVNRTHARFVMRAMLDWMCAVSL